MTLKYSTKRHSNRYLENGVSKSFVHNKTSENISLQLYRLYPGADGVIWKIG